MRALKIPYRDDLMVALGGAVRHAGRRAVARG